jgi:bacteriocin-like protein
MVLPIKQETDMTELNHEISELSFDELEQVSGGSIIDIIVNAYLAAVGKNLMDAIHPPAPKQTMSMHMR